MSPIDWQRLVREHDRAPERDDEGWLEALAILDEDPEQRRRAEEADPLLIFRRMPAPRVDGSDVESMKAAVKNLRQASETLAENAPPRPALLPASLLPASLLTGSPAARRLWPLAALLVIGISIALVGAFGVDMAIPGASFAGSPAAWSPVDQPTRAEAPFGAGVVRAELRSADTELGFAAARIDGAAAASLAAAELPLVEDADPGADLLMQIENEEMSLVVVLTDQDV